MIPFSIIVISQLFKDIVELFGVDLGSHSRNLCPFWEEFLKPAANVLTEGEEHVVSGQFVEGLFGKIGAI